MKNILEYKGYWTEIEIEFDTGLLRGQIAAIRDKVRFESENVRGIIREFHSAVDRYMEYCDMAGDLSNIPSEKPPINAIDKAQVVITIQVKE